LGKKTKTSHLDHSGHIEGDVMENHDQKEKVEKSGKSSFCGQNKIYS
jgi:hypothetical protein